MNDAETSYSKAINAHVKPLGSASSHNSHASGHCLTAKLERAILECTVRMHMKASMRALSPHSLDLMIDSNVF